MQLHNNLFNVPAKGTLAYFTERERQMIPKCIGNVYPVSIKEEWRQIERINILRFVINLLELHDEKTILPAYCWQNFVFVAASFWTAEEVDLSKDKDDWVKLSVRF